MARPGAAETPYRECLLRAIVRGTAASRRLGGVLGAPDSTLFPLRRIMARRGAHGAMPDRFGRSADPVRLEQWRGAATLEADGLGSHWRADGAPKRAYGSESEAWIAAEGRRDSTGVVLRVYRCDVCPAWHMTKTDGRDRP